MILRPLHAALLALAVTLAAVALVFGALPLASLLLDEPAISMRR
jgi:hypothetical protein